MIRLMIDWAFVSPLLQVAIGILKAEVVRNGQVDILLFKCKVTKEQGTTGYTSLDEESLGIPSKLFEALKPSIDIMVHSYFQGMILEKQDFHWIEDSISGPISFEEWATKHEIDASEYLK